MRWWLNDSRRWWLTRSRRWWLIDIIIWLLVGSMRQWLVDSRIWLLVGSMRLGSLAAEGRSLVSYNTDCMDRGWSPKKRKTFLFRLKPSKHFRLETRWCLAYLRVLSKHNFIGGSFEFSMMSTFLLVLDKFRTDYLVWSVVFSHPSDKNVRDIPFALSKDLWLCGWQDLPWTITSVINNCCSYISTCSVNSKSVTLCRMAGAPNEEKEDIKRLERYFSCSLWRQGP